MSTAVWIAVALMSLIGIVTVIRLSRPRRHGGDGSDLGSVSEQWISEHRAGQWGDGR
jgi:hypothetical protein